MKERKSNAYFPQLTWRDDSISQLRFQPLLPVQPVNHVGLLADELFGHAV